MKSMVENGNDSMQLNAVVSSRFNGVVKLLVDDVVLKLLAIRLRAMGALIVFILGL